MTEPVWILAIALEERSSTCCDSLTSWDVTLVCLTNSYVAGMSDGWWLTPSGNGGPLVAISGHQGRTP